MSQIHIMNGQSDQILDVIVSDYIIDNVHRKSLKDNIETFNFETFAEQRFSSYLGKNNRIVIPDEDGSYQEFTILEARKYRAFDGLLALEVYTSASYQQLTKENVITPQTLTERTTSQLTSLALFGTEWEPGTITYAGTKTIEIEEHTNPFALLKRIASEFDLELNFRVDIDGNRIIGRYVDLLPIEGQWRGREVEFGRDLIGIERRERTDELVTALVGLGPIREDDTRLEVLVENFDALERWGRKGQHLIETYEPQTDDQDMTLDQLRELTEAELKKRVNAIVEYQADLADLERVPGLENKKIRFGDVIKIKDTTFNPPLYLEARVHTQERNIVDQSQKTVELGDFIEYTEEELLSIWKSLQMQIRLKLSLNDLKENTYTKPEIDQKDAAVYQDGTQYTDQRSDRVKQEAEQDATNKANQAENNAKQYTDNVATQVEQSSRQFTEQYAEKKVLQGTTPPSNPSTGDLWIDIGQDPHVWKRWNGSQWEALERTDLSQLQGQIQSDQIANGVIISDKMADLAVTLGKIADNAVNADKIAANAVTAQKIATGAVETDKLAANSVIADKIAASAITTGKIAAGAVTAAKIAAGTITSDLISTAGLDAGVIKFGTMSGQRIQANTITANQLAAGSVLTDKIEANAVTAAKIDTGAVTANKINVTSLSAISANLGTINAGTINGVTINGGTITQTSADGSVKLDNTGLTVSSNSGAKILMNISNLGGNHGDDLSLTFIDQNGNVGMDIYDYYVDSVIQTSRRLTLKGGDLGITIDGSGTITDTGVRITGGLDVALMINMRNVDGFVNGRRGLVFPNQNTFSMLNNTLTVFANRSGNPFQIRTHDNGSNFRSDFIVLSSGNVQFPQSYNNTTGSAANLRINSNGTLERSTSARKYKQDIKPIDTSNGYHERLLNLYPKNWFDKLEVERNSGSTEGLRRYHGLVAEDLVEVGLSEYVTYENGIVEGIEYDRLWTLLIPIVRDLKDEINGLKIENQRLDRKIKQLETS